MTIPQNWQVGVNFFWRLSVIFVKKKGLIV